MVQTRQTRKRSSCSASLEHESPSSTDQELKSYVKVTKTMTFGFEPVKKKESTTREVNSCDDAIGDIKEKLCEINGIETNLQKVFFMEKSLENGQVLNYGSKDGSTSVTMHLHFGAKIQIFVKLYSTAKSIPLDVHSWDTIRDVKTMIQNKEGTPTEQLTLFYSGKQLDDSKTLTSYGVENDATLSVVVLEEDLIRLSVRVADAETIELKVKLCSRVENLKTMIHCMIGYAVDQQELTLAGRLLENGHMLADYPLQTQSVLDLKLLLSGSMKIYVNTPAGEKMPFYVNGSSTIDELKQKVHLVCGIPSDLQRFIFAGKQLEDHLTVGSCGIYKDCCVHLVLRLCGC